MQNIRISSYRTPMTLKNDPSVSPKTMISDSRVMVNSLDVSLYLGIPHFELLEVIDRVSDGRHGWTEADLKPVPLRIFIGGEMREHLSVNMSTDAVIALTALFKGKGMAAKRRRFISFMSACEDAYLHS